MRIVVIAIAALAFALMSGCEEAEFNVLSQNDKGITIKYHGQGLRQEAAFQAAEGHCKSLGKSAVLISQNNIGPRGRSAVASFRCE